MVESSNASQSQVDINQIATDLNGKMDVDGLNASCPVVIETYHSDTNWYRLWSDGWCEQGGSSYIASDGANVSLLKNFRDTNYNIQCTGRNNLYAEVLYVKSRTTSNFSMYTGDDNSFNAGTIDWCAKGYIR